MHNYPLEKYHFYQHGNRIIAVSTYAGRTVRGVAVCSADDQFDVQRGKELAAARCNQKIAQKRVARAYKRLNEAANEVAVAMHHRDKMDTYYEDAIVAFDEASRAIESLENAY